MFYWRWSHLLCPSRKITPATESQPAGRTGLFPAQKAPFAGAGVPKRATAAVTASATSPRPGRMPPRRRAAGKSGGVEPHKCPRLPAVRRRWVRKALERYLLRLPHPDASAPRSAWPATQTAAGTGFCGADLAQMYVRTCHVVDLTPCPLHLAWTLTLLSVRFRELFLRPLVVLTAPHCPNLYPVTHAQHCHSPAARPTSICAVVSPRPAG